MAVADKLVTIAENEQRVYDAGETKGQKAEYDNFWDWYQNKGNAMSYKNAFSGLGWNRYTFKPKHNIITTNCQHMFLESNIYLDFKQYCADKGIGISFVGSGLGGDYTFHGSMFYKLPFMDLSNLGDLYSFFGSCIQLTEVSFALNSNGTQTFTSVFNNSTQLEIINITSGKIGKNGFNVSMCTKLTHDSLISILNALKDFSTTTAVSVPNTVLPVGSKIVDFAWIDDTGATVKYSDLPAVPIQYYIDLFDANNDPISAYMGTVIESPNIKLAFQIGKISYKRNGVDTEWFDIASITIRTTPTTTQTITLGTTNLAKLTSSEISEATLKGWSLV